MNRLATLLVSSMLALPVSGLSGCSYRVSEYSGNGHLIDNRPRAATDRYVLDVGPIDLTRRGTTTFRIVDLPEVNFAAGLEIRVAPQDRAALEQRPVKATVSLTLSDSTGTVLFEKTAPLDAWTWSVRRGAHQAFVYGRGEPGTYFTARPKTEYTLTLGVVDPDSNATKYTAALLAKSGGWK